MTPIQIVQVVPGNGKAIDTATSANALPTRMDQGFDCTQCDRVNVIALPTGGVRFKFQVVWGWSIAGQWAIDGNIGLVDVPTAGGVVARVATPAGADRMFILTSAFNAATADVWLQGVKGQS